MNIQEEIINVIGEACEMALATDYGGVPVVEGYQEAPAPKEDVYVSIGFPSVTEVGFPSYASEVDDQTETITKVVNYQGFVDIMQTGGNGEELRVILQAFYSLVLESFLVSKNLTIYANQGINFLPRTENQKWVKEFTTELRISYAVVSTETRSWIETIEFVNQIGE